MAEHLHPQAVWFGRGTPSSFGMVHSPIKSDHWGVVICNALGFEGLLAHRPLRHLATTLAERGATVIRVDYPGSGDAPDDAAMPTHLDGCLAAIADAVNLLRRDHNCTRISLVGIRAGAALATAFAADHPVDDLVLWAPVERGSSYVRELKALARLSAASRPASNPPADAGAQLEVVGFEFGDDLLADLATLDAAARIAAADVAPASRALVVDRDDGTRADALVAALESVEIELERRTAPGWADFMVNDETQSVMPTGALATITDWLDRPGVALGAGANVAATAQHETGPALTTARRLQVDGVAEWPAWIDDRMFALVTEPDRSSPARHRSVVIMPNTGSVNRTGPGRLYTQLARSWARMGMTVVRIDLGGTGDSPTSGGEPENLPYAVRRIEELHDVIGWARDHLKADEVNLFGICSGAFQSFHAALMGADVRRVVMVNPAIFYLGPDQTVGTSTSKAMIATHNLWRLRFVRSQISRACRSPRDLAQFARRAGRGIGYTAAAWARRMLRRAGLKIAVQEDLARDLQRLADHEVEVVFVFAADEPGLRYLHVFGGRVLGQLCGAQSVTLLEIAGGDHVFSPPRARRSMITAVTKHLVPSGSTPPVEPASVGQG